MATVTSHTSAAPARTRAPIRRSGPMRAPRRVSGPVGGRSAAAVAPRESLDFGGRALALVRGLPDHSVIDRLVRGRAWIPVLGVLLAGMVAMQVEILKLGASTGRAIEQTATLQTQNEALQANVATLGDDQRIERIAAARGMAMPSPGSLVFLTAHPGGQVARALGNIHTPDPSGFTSQLAAQAQAAAALAAPASSTTAAPAQTTSTSAPTSTITPTSPAPAASASTPPASGQPVVPSPAASASPATSTPTTTSVPAPVPTATGAASVAASPPSATTGG
jgi:cell division protein FtsL